MLFFPYLKMGFPLKEDGNQVSYRGVAQFGSALALGARGCQFESGHPDHFLKDGYVNKVFKRGPRMRPSGI